MSLGDHCYPMNFENANPAGGPKAMKERDLLLKRIIELSVNGLIYMFDEEKNLYCHKVRRVPNGMVREGLSLRYTIISLLGLQRFEAYGGRSGIDLQRAFESTLRSGYKIDNIGDLGLLLWLLALSSPQHISAISAELDVKEALKRYPDARVGKTTEVAWFLAGLSHIALALVECPQWLESLATQTYVLLKENYGGKGVFGHLKRNTLPGIIRGRIGSFADQVYPIYALCKFGKAYENSEALTIAKDSGEAICRLQGPYGQWWWHYDAISGQVIGRYPVYSVHQDGMGPMALFALGEATGECFEFYIYKGLDWISGANELRENLVDYTRGVIWRSFYRTKAKMYLEEVLSLARLNDGKDKVNDLSILFECRPYHLGWLLYAFANRK
jgi:hypothetical protein